MSSDKKSVFLGMVLPAVALILISLSEISPWFGIIGGLIGLASFVFTVVDRVQRHRAENPLLLIRLCYEGGGEQRFGIDLIYTRGKRIVVFVDEIVIFWENDVREIYMLRRPIPLSPDNPLAHYWIDRNPHSKLKIVDVVISDVMNRKYTFSSNPKQKRELIP